MELLFYGKKHIMCFCEAVRISLVRHACLVTSVVFYSLQPYGLYSPPDSSVHGILQAGILQWDAVPSLRGASLPRD